MSTFMWAALVVFVMAVALVRFGIRTYFREKQEHLRSLLGAADSKKGES